MPAVNACGEPIAASVICSSRNENMRVKGTYRYIKGYMGVVGICRSIQGFIWILVLWVLPSNGFLRNIPGHS